MIAYTVRCAFEDRAVAEEWTAWLLEKHLEDVITAGAISAELVRLDGTALVLEARYRFASRKAFETYERDEAPGLREEGLRLFPLTRGLSYSRLVGEVLTRDR